jgi:hypothetical protein
MMYLLLSKGTLKCHSGIPSSAQRLGHKSRDNLSNTYTPRKPYKRALSLLAFGILFRVLVLCCVCCRPSGRE